MLRTYQRRKAAAVLQAEGGAAAGPTGAAEVRLLSDSQNSWEWSSQGSSAACLPASFESQDDVFAEGAAAVPAADHEQEDNNDVDVVPESPEEKAWDHNQQCRRRIAQGDAALLFNSLEAVRFLVKLLHQFVPASVKPQDKSATAATEIIKALFVDSTNDDGSQVSVSMRELSSAAPAQTLLPDEVVDTRTLALIAVGSGCSEKDMLTVAFVGQRGCDVARVSCSGRSQGEAEFKDRFREVGGLDDVAQLMADSWCKLSMKVQSPESALDFDNEEAEPDSATSLLVMLLRCLHILDNASFMNRTSQQHLIDFRVRDGKGTWVPFIRSVLQVLSLRADMSGGAEGDLRNECAIAASKVLLNLTNNSPSGCAQVMANDGMPTLVALLYPSNSKIILRTANEESQNSVNSVSSSSSDIVVAAMGVLVNLVEKDAANRGKLATLQLADETAASVVDQLVHLFLEYGKDELDEPSPLHAEMSEWDSFEQGRREAEDSIIAAYSAILLALLASDSPVTRRKVLSMLPGHALLPLVPVLERFLAFHIQVKAFSEQTLESMQRLVDSCQLLP
eukprot:jgi/Chlat1/7016/Chrsp56S06661